MVFLTDSFQDLEDYLEWKQIHRKNWDRIFLLTINTKLCREQGIGICKINRDREFIAQGVPPEAIVACGNFQEQLASVVINITDITFCILSEVIKCKYRKN